MKGDVTMAIIRDGDGNIYNIPDSELKKYLVHVVALQSGPVNEEGQPETICLEPRFDSAAGPHDGWGYMKDSSRPLPSK